MSRFYCFLSLGLLVLVSSSCSRSADPGVANLSDGCTLITSSQIASALGAHVDNGGQAVSEFGYDSDKGGAYVVHDQTTCNYDASITSGSIGGTFSMTGGWVQVALISPADYQKAKVGTAGHSQVVTGLGDDAFWSDRELFVRKGNVAFSLTMLDTDELEAAKTLARAALTRMPDRLTNAPTPYALLAKDVPTNQPDNSSASSQDQSTPSPAPMPAPIPAPTPAPQPMPAQAGQGGFPSAAVGPCIRPRPAGDQRRVSVRRAAAERQQLRACSTGRDVDTAEPAPAERSTAGDARHARATRSRRTASRTARSGLSDPDSVDPNFRPPGVAQP